ncbi:DUF4435 domain-containing protein [Asticcacaulis sp.]|uniref:DUF4435 domain-containing protein n=1 Tax=Asticcacaulis sp. TaxID=1872648 RepID=UPI0031D858B6
MSMLDEHNSALSTGSECYHNFLLKYKPNKKFVYAIVEGVEDPIFYKYIIQKLIPETWDVIFITSGSKYKSIDAHRIFNWETLDKRRICFFLDTDLDKYLGKNQKIETNFYYTDGYSIENSIVSSCLFLNFIEDIYGCGELDEPQREEIIEYFETGLSEFKNIMSGVMAYFAWATRNNVKCRWSRVNVSNIFKIENGSPAITDDCKTIESLCEYLTDRLGCHYPDINEINFELRMLLDGGWLNEFVRGKFIFKFFHSISLYIEHNKHFDFIDRNSKPRISINSAKLNSLIAPYSRTPDSLNRFILSNFLGYIHSTE